MSLKILLFFALGVFAGIAGWSGLLPVETDLSRYALYLLMLLVGISIGADSTSLLVLKEQGLRLLILPASTVAGTLGGVMIIAFFLHGISTQEALAVGAGFGYYSLSSIIISELHSDVLGVTALLSNVSREILTLLLAPLMVVFFGKLSPVAAAGATSMDTTLPVITAVSGKDVAVVALLHGIVLTLLVPLLVSFILWV
ncbi:MAG: lysine exporter LysO family protein [Bacteroidales bacterium]|nr:lysine exporter LysO family protein [Bacteroidales bacterium]